MAHMVLLGSRADLRSSLEMAGVLAAAGLVAVPVYAAAAAADAGLLPAAVDAGWAPEAAMSAAFALAWHAVVSDSVRAVQAVRALVS